MIATMTLRPTASKPGEAHRPSPGAVIFAGGGTGGHLFPALAIAEHLGAPPLPGGALPLQSFFICSTRPLDAEILSKQDVTFSTVPAQPPATSPRALVRFLRSWGPSVRTGRDLIRNLKRSHGRVQLVAMGGFVAAPLAQAARVERIPVTLVNLDAVPGRANRFIARHADAIFTSAPVARARWTAVPPIVRAAAVADADPSLCRTRFGLAPDVPTLLVTGASQGARSINTFLALFIERRAQSLADWQVIHQTGKEGAESLRAAYAAHNIPAVVEPFFDDMGSAWGAADLAISRAGAGNVAEVWANRVPTIFMPYPHHKDQHQRLNAEPLAAKGAAVIAADQVRPEANLASVGPVLLDLLSNPQKRLAMSQALSALGPADGAARIAHALLQASRAL